MRPLRDGLGNKAVRQVGVAWILTVIRVDDIRNHHAGRLRATRLTIEMRVEEGRNVIDLSPDRLIVVTSTIMWADGFTDRLSIHPLGKLIVNEGNVNTIAMEPDVGETFAGRTIVRIPGGMRIVIRVDGHADRHLRVNVITIVAMNARIIIGDHLHLPLIHLR